MNPEIEATDMTESTNGAYRISEVSEGRFFAGHIFRDKLGDEVPDEPRHLVAFYRLGTTRFVPLGYLHILEAQGQGLIGGACVDGRAFVDVPDTARQGIQQRGGVLQTMLEFATDRLGSHYEAFFAYTGNQRAAAANLRAGYIKTEYEHLFARFHRTLDSARKRELIEQVHDFGPF